MSRKICTKHQIDERLKDSKVGLHRWIRRNECVELSGCRAPIDDCLLNVFNGLPKHANHGQISVHLFTVAGNNDM